MHDVVRRQKVQARTKYGVFVYMKPNHICSYKSTPENAVFLFDVSVRRVCYSSSEADEACRRQLHDSRRLLPNSIDST